jgi:hypothetical protein
MKDVIGIGYETLQELRMKEWNVTLDGFQELVILIFEGAIVVILLHNFVLSNQTYNISPRWLTCGSLMPMWKGHVFLSEDGNVWT